MGDMTPERAIQILSEEADVPANALKMIKGKNERMGRPPIPGQQEIFDELQRQESEFRQIIDLIVRLAKAPTPSPRMFPLQRPRSAKSAPHPLQIPWSVAEKAYCEYARQYGRGQSLERLAERGGFDGAEMDELYPPWREEVSEITSLLVRLDEAKVISEKAEEKIDRLERTIRLLAAECVAHRNYPDEDEMGTGDPENEAVNITRMAKLGTAMDDTDADEHARAALEGAAS